MKLILITLSLLLSQNIYALTTKCDVLSAHPNDPNKTSQGVEWDDIKTSKALLACQEAITKYPGNSRLQYQLGRIHIKNNSLKTGTALFKKSAHQKYPAAELAMGSAYEVGQGVKQDFNKAHKWYEKSESHGNSYAAFKLGNLYSLKEFTKHDYNKSLKWYKKAADKGEIFAMYNMALIYEVGNNIINKNHTEAFKWYKKAAVKGLVQAQFKLGYLYGDKHFIKHDFSKSIRWYKKASDNGDVLSSYNLAVMYETGNGVKKNIHRAISFFKRCTRKNYSPAYIAIAQIYANGTTNKDFKNSLLWIEKAKENNVQDEKLSLLKASVNKKIAQLKSNDKELATIYIKKFKAIFTEEATIHKMWINIIKSNEKKIYFSDEILSVLENIKNTQEKRCKNYFLLHSTVKDINNHKVQKILSGATNKIERHCSIRKKFYIASYVLYSTNINNRKIIHKTYVVTSTLDSELRESNKHQDDVVNMISNVTNILGMNSNLATY